MRVHHSYGPAIVLFIVAFASPASAQSWLPSNLHVEPIYRELVESMAEQSPTFRMQLARIALEVNRRLSSVDRRWTVFGIGRP